MHKNVHLVFESYHPLAKADDTFSDPRWKTERQNRPIISSFFFFFLINEGIESPKGISKCTAIPLASVYRRRMVSYKLMLQVCQLESTASTDRQGGNTDC